MQVWDTVGGKIRRIFGKRMVGRGFSFVDLGQFYGLLGLC